MADALDDTRPALRYGRLSTSLGFLLRLSQLRSFGDFFRAMGPLDVRPGEISVLMVLNENPGIRQGVLAEALSIKRAHMAKMVRAMEQDGVIRRSVPEDDRRAMELWLTDAGRARIDRLRPRFEGHETRNIDGLTPQEAQELKRLLRKYLGMEEEPT